MLLEELRLRKLNYSDIRMNRPLAWDVFDDCGLLLLRKGYVIETETQVRGLVERGLYIVADNVDMPAAAPVPTPEIKFDPFWLWDDMHSKLVRVLRDIETEELVEDKITGIALLVNVLTDKDPDAALGAILLKDSLRYAYTHALHVAVMAAIISKKLNWGDDERRDLVCAALSMNAAMVTLQTQLLQQRTPLTPEQREALDRHPREGRELLLRKGVRNSRWLRTIELHHQRLDVPAEALTRPDAAAMAQLIRTLDVFCAKISPRAYRQAMLPPVAARDIFVAEREFNNPFLGPLIKEVGIYMPGTFIKLENGEIALVIRRGPSVDTPRAIALSRSDGTPYMDAMRRDTTKPEYAVKGAIPKEKVLQRVNLSRVWGYQAQ